MKIGRVMLSGIAVYVLVAACSAMDAQSVRSAGNGGHEDGSGAGAGRGGGGGLIDPVPPVSADPTSGSRLRAKSWIGDDGSIMFQPGVWHDSKLGVDCVPAHDHDGQLRCLPGALTGSTVYPYFIDSACSVHAAFVPCWSGTVSFYSDPYDGPTQACSAAPWIHRLGARASKAYVNNGVGCIEQPITAGAVFAPGDRVDPAEFVALREKTE